MAFLELRHDIYANIYRAGLSHINAKILSARTELCGHNLLPRKGILFPPKHLCSTQKGKKTQRQEGSRPCSNASPTASLRQSCSPKRLQQRPHQEVPTSLSSALALGDSIEGAWVLITSDYFYIFPSSLVLDYLLLYNSKLSQHPAEQPNFRVNPNAQGYCCL